MLRYLLVLALAVLSTAPGQAQPSSPKPPPRKTFIAGGAQVGAVPEVVYSHLKLEALKPGQGVVVEQIVPDSAAARAGLQRHDILLSLGNKTIRDGDHFVRLVEEGAPEEKVQVVLVRNGELMSVRACLALGATDLETTVPKGMIRPGGPDAVSVKAESLTDQTLRVTFIYSDGTGKLRRLTREGSLPAIQQQVRTLCDTNQIPAEVQDLIDVALKRLRTLNAP